MSNSLFPLYPATSPERDKWVLLHRGERASLDPLQPYRFFVEDERSTTGEIVQVATVFLTNRECPWKCVMCDLWRNTLTHAVPAGAIPAQIDYALQRLGPAREIKLYNSGSFFDVQAIPSEDYLRISGQVSAFERVIVECHPMLVGEQCLRFRGRLRGRMEVAMGLETAHPETLARLNKKMTLEDFAAAAGRLHSHDIDLRVFILVNPPFIKEEESLECTRRSLDFAFDCGATAAALIPTRGGNGAMEELAAMGLFSPPRMSAVEAAAEYGLTLKRGRVFVDLWDTPVLGTCSNCHDARLARLRQMNLHQTIPDAIVCDQGEACG